MSRVKKAASGRMGKSAGKLPKPLPGKRAKPQTAGKKPVQKKGKGNPLDALLTKAAKHFVKAGGTRLLLKVFPYLLFGYFGDKLAYAYRMTAAPDFFNRLVGCLANLGTAFANVLPSFHPKDLFFGAVFGAGIRLAVYFKGKNAKKFRKGVEYGSARWRALPRRKRRSPRICSTNASSWTS